MVELMNTVQHLMGNVLPAARDYEKAEHELSSAFDPGADPKSWEREGQQARRRAAEVAVAIDGLVDRATAELGLSAEVVRKQVTSRCTIEGVARLGSIERVCAVANAYKHFGPLHPKHPIRSEFDVLATGAGFGVDGFGMGKFGGVEVLVNQKDGTVRKFLADVPAAIAGWFQFLADHGATLPPEEQRVCNLMVKAKSTPASGTP